MQKLLKKPFFIPLTVLLLMFGAFILRSWQFSGNLYFQMDQARDAALIKNALENGPSHLPLLGPRAAGTFLRLGPIFYYFQYTSAYIFQSAEPFVLAYPDLFFSILTIPLFYVLLRQFFRPGTSLLITSLFSFSFMAAQYSRFAWNPNSIPFWGLLFILGLYKTVTAKSIVSRETLKKKKIGRLFHVKQSKGFWLLATVLAYSIVSQLHFLALLTFPLVALVFWMFFRPKGIRWYFWLGSIMILTFFYTPMVLSETQTNWDNSHQFVYAVTANSSPKKQGASLFEKVNTSFKLHSKYYSLFLSSYGNTDHQLFKVFFLLLFTFGVWYAWQIVSRETITNLEAKKRRWETIKEKIKLFHVKHFIINGVKTKNNQVIFLFLILVWFFVFAASFTKLSGEVAKPRFWLLVIYLPFVFLAFLFDWLYRPGFKKRGAWTISIIFTGLLSANIYAIGYWYWMLNTGKRLENIPLNRDLVLKQKDLVTLNQMKQTGMRMQNVSRETSKQICYFADSDYRAAYEYVLDVYHPKADYKRITFDKDTNEKCVFFSIDRRKDSNYPKLPKDHLDKFKPLNETRIGQITLWQMKRTDLFYLKDKILKDLIKDEEELKKVLQQKQTQKEQQKKEIEALIKSDDANDMREEEEIIKEKVIENRKKPKRKERIFWFDIIK